MILDLFSRKVVGSKLGETLEAELVVVALKNALMRRQPDPGLYFHSDQGSQYSSEAVKTPLAVIGANLSMSGRGNCYDNAKAEAFFSTLKTECFPTNQLFATKGEARREIFEYIEVYYNNKRLHSALGYQTPSQYETEFSRVIDIAISSAQSIDVAPEDRALQGFNSSADATLQTAGKAASQAGCRLGRDLPAQAKSDKSQGVRGTESPDPINQTLKKTEKLVSVFPGEVQVIEGSDLTIPEFDREEEEVERPRKILVHQLPLKFGKRKSYSVHPAARIVVWTSQDSHGVRHDVETTGGVRTPIAAYIRYRLERAIEYEERKAIGNHQGHRKQKNKVGKSGK